MRLIHRLLLMGLVTIAFFFAAQRAFTDTEPSMASILEPIRVEYDLPALAGAIFTTEGVVEMGAVGVRKVDTTVPVTTHDLWHLGSDTKALTAMLVGTYVAEKKLSWNTKVVSFFPEIADKVPKKIRNITIAQVLSHEAGLQGCDTWIYSDKTDGPTGTIREERINAARSALLSPKYDPGTFHYSNIDYILIGTVLEKLGGVMGGPDAPANLPTPRHENGRIRRYRNCWPD
jgi:CubicO group peptidase (beta-lactamase class C family)